MPKGIEERRSRTPSGNRFREIIQILLCALAVAVAAVLWPASFGADDPAMTGQWSASAAWPTYAIHAHVLPSGKVLFWNEPDPDLLNYMWDPGANSFSPVTGSGYAHFCTGHCLLADGRLFVAGGHVTEQVGLPNASIFDPGTESWIHLPDMNAARWYPTTTTLPNGDVAVVSGSIDETSHNNIPQVWQTVPGSWRDLTGATIDVGNYPWMFVAPNGKLFRAGQGRDTRYLDTSGTGSWTLVGSEAVLHGDYGTAVMYVPGKVLVVGGADPPVSTAEVIDLTVASPSWQTIVSMSVARRQLNATLLPDGKVLVTGGSSGGGFNNSGAAVTAAEVWNPSNGMWTTLASSTIYRGYHSVAFLLPDGRVVTAGGTSNTYANGEIFSPPYLFQGTRPTISSAPTDVRYGQSFFVGSSDAANIARVTWVRLSSVTHSFNANQRFNELSFTQAQGGLQVTAPSNPALCPPGHYMLFLLDGSGVPSVSKIVRIAANQRRTQLISQ